MIADRLLRSRHAAVYAALIVVVLVCCGSLLRALGGEPAAPAAPGMPAEDAPPPWTSAQTVEPADLAKALAGPAGRAPTVVCVGFPSLYRAGHIQGASLHGPASTADGLADLKAWADHLPRSSDLVVYCGCCPIASCPNLHPAFTALSEMGFTHVRVLMLTNSFAADWAERGYPIEPHTP